MAEDTIKDLKKKIEAILYSAGRAVDIEELSSLCGIKEHSIIKEAIKELKSDFSGRESPLLLIEEGNGWKLIVGEKYLDTVRSVTPHTELDKAILETLAIIAYKQPVLQSMVIKIRTSAAYEHIARLVEMGFISKEKKGRSFVLKPTGRFFDYFDLPSKDRLKELFKDIESPKDELKADSGLPEGMDEPETEKEHGKKKLGGLSVYETTAVKDEKGKDSSENVETLGKLEVVEYPEEEEKEEAEEENEEEKEGYDEKKAMDIITKLAEDKDEEVKEKDEEEKENIDPELDEFSKRKEKEDITEEDEGKEEFEKELKNKKKQLDEEDEEKEQNEEGSEDKEPKDEEDSESKDEDTDNEDKEDKNKDEEENEDKGESENKEKNSKDKNKNKKKSFDDLFEDGDEK